MTERIVTRILWVIFWPIAAILVMVIGLFSMYRVGCVLEKVGQNCQLYKW